MFKVNNKNTRMTALWLGKKTLKMQNLNFNGNTYGNSNEEKILGNIIDNPLLFDSHIKKSV